MTNEECKNIMLPLLYIALTVLAEKTERYP